MDNKRIEEQWRKIKPYVLNHWSKLTEAEVDKTHGHVKLLKRLILSKYGSHIKFDQDYEKICSHIMKKKAGIERNDDLNDEDIGGVHSFNNHSADYSGVTLSELEQEEMLQPDLKGIEASEAQTHQMKMKTDEIFQNSIIQTAPDEFKPNHVPHSLSNEDFTLRRSNSSANTTSPSALFSSESSKEL